MFSKFGIPEALKSCISLQNLSIQLELLGEPTGDPCFFPLKGFRNLSSIELYGFQDPNDDLFGQLADVLTECPRLRTLGLSMMSTYDVDEYPDTLLVNELYMDFLEKLCNEYSAKRGGKPLELQTLRLGHGMYMFSKNWDSDEDSDEEQEWCLVNFLADFVKLDSLRNLHLYNGVTLHPGGFEGDEGPLDIAWSFLNDYTSLRQLQVSRLWQNTAKWLSEHGHGVEELIITEEYSMFDEDRDALSALELPNLTMLFTREMRVRRDPSTSTITILDYFGGNRKALTKLAFCIDLTTEWVCLTLMAVFLLADFYRNILQTSYEV